MKLITETIDDVKFLTEENDNGKKSYYIEGIFAQADKQNRNGRVYPKSTLIKEIKRYNDKYVKEKRALGELGHPDGPSVNLDRVSHIITELKSNGSDVYGKAKVMDTPMGKIAQNLIEEGARLGVSTRGMGSLKKIESYNEVQEDFMLSAVDIVADPSAPDAFVNGIMEGKEWVWDNGIIKEVQIDSYQKQIQQTTKRDMERVKLEVFSDMLESLSRNTRLYK